MEDALQVSETSDQIFLFLFRRLSGKTLSIQFLKELFLAKEKIFNLAMILNKILDNYRLAKHEIEIFKRNRNIATGRFSIDNFPRLRSGENFLKMREINTEIFLPVITIFYEDQNLLNYLFDILVAFLGFAVEKKIDVGQAIERHILRVFLKLRKFTLISQFVTNNILSDSESLAVILCELGSDPKKLNHGDKFLEECVSLIVDCKYEGALQMGIDLAYRLGNGNLEKRSYFHNMIFDYFVRNHKILECLYMLDNKDLDINSVKLEHFLRAAHSKGSNYGFFKVLDYLS
jgi:hypothetical protein